MIKGIIFDIGGVLVDVKIRGFLKKFVEESGFTKDQLYMMIVMGKEWENFEKGLITEDKLKEKIEKDHGVDPKLMDKMASDWRKSIKPKKETIKIAEELCRKYKLFALSNVDKKTTELCFDKFDFYNCFDEIILSYKIHMRKPDREIYEYAIKRTGLKPEELIFIDNYPKNLPEAEKLGIKTILFTSPSQLRKDLKKAGVDIKQ